MLKRLLAALLLTAWVAGCGSDASVKNEKSTEPPAAPSAGPKISPPPPPPPGPHK